MNLKIVLVTAAVLLVCFMVGDLIPVADHLGWDGNRYGKWVKELSLNSLQGGLNSYEARRFVPSLLVRWTLLGLHLDLNNSNIVATYRIANFLMIVLAVYLWCRSADLVGINTTGKWLGFVGLVLNHAVLKVAFFYPVLTDCFALALGSACLFLYLSRRPFSLFVVSLVGSFVWPTMLHFGLLMLAFPRPSEAPPAPRRSRLAPWVATSAAVAALVTVGLVVASGFNLKSTPVHLWSSLSYLSAAMVAGYLFFGFLHLSDSQALWRDLNPIRVVRRWWFWCALSLPLMVGVISHWLISEPAKVTGKRIVFEIFYTGITEPGIFLLAHILYYGPIIVLTVFLWPRVASGVLSFGTGLTLCFFLALLIGQGSESRKWINFLPVVVLATSYAAQSFDWSRWRLPLFAGLSLLLSKVWLPMGRDLTLPVIGEVSWRTLYSSSQGPWIDHGLYLGQLAAVAAVAGAIYLFAVRGNQDQATDIQGL